MFRTGSRRMVNQLPQPLRWYHHSFCTPKRESAMCT